MAVELTPREREIAAQLVTGKTSKQIGRALDISPRTVDVYRARLMRKYDTGNATELLQRLLGHVKPPRRQARGTRLSIAAQAALTSAARSMVSRSRSGTGTDLPAA